MMFLCPCREFLLNTVPGVLNVHVRSAKNLAVGDVRSPASLSSTLTCAQSVVCVSELTCSQHVVQQGTCQ